MLVVIESMTYNRHSHAHKHASTFGRQCGHVTCFFQLRRAVGAGGEVGWWCMVMLEVQLQPNQSAAQQISLGEELTTRRPYLG